MICYAWLCFVGKGIVYS